MSDHRRTAEKVLALGLRRHGVPVFEISARLRMKFPDLGAIAAMRIAHGWTQREAAEAWSQCWPNQLKTEKDIGLWEIRRPGFATLGKLARVYQCAVSDLVAGVDDYRHFDPIAPPRPVVTTASFGERSEDIGYDAVCLADDMVLVTVDGPDGSSNVVKIGRREILRGLGAMALTSMTSPASPITESRSSDLLPIEHLRHVRQALIEIDNRYGAVAALPSVYDQIRLLEHLRRSTLGADAVALLSLQVEFTESAAWLNQDLVDFATAWAWTDRALDLAHLADDVELVSNVLARKSQLAGDMGDAEHAIGYGKAALAIAPRPGCRPRPPRSPLTVTPSPVIATPSTGPTTKRASCWKRPTSIQKADGGPGLMNRTLPPSEHGACRPAATTAKRLTCLTKPSPLRRSPSHATVPYIFPALPGPTQPSANQPRRPRSQLRPSNLPPSQAASITSYGCCSAPSSKAAHPNSPKSAIGRNWRACFLLTSSRD